MKEWQSPQELAEELGVPLPTVYGWRHRGGGPVGHKLGGHVRFRREDVEAWLAERRDGAPEHKSEEPDAWRADVHFVPPEWLMNLYADIARL